MKTFKSPAIRSKLALTSGLIALAAAVHAANHVVNMTTLLAFSPDYLEIQPGDTVTWHNQDESDSHDARSTTDLWDTGGISPDEDSEPVPFNTAGTFPYYDTGYSQAGMIGTIVVSAVTPPPDPATLIDPQFLSGGAFCFTITNLTVGKTNVVEMSTNLTQWTPLLTNVPGDVSMSVTNAAALSTQFYRSSQLP